jgi:hypothetical protein
MGVDKISLERYDCGEMNTTENLKSLPSQTPRVFQDHIAIGVILIIGINHTSHQGNHTQNHIGKPAELIARPTPVRAGAAAVARQ